MKTIGIIGGMGPSATYDLANKIVINTKAACDQEHIHVLIDCNTNIPDRTAAILNREEDPVPELVKSALRLENMGADFLIMPCNTAHFFYKSISKFLDIPLLHMLQETAKLLKLNNICCAGVLATDGTKETHIYEDALKSQKISVAYPSKENQSLLMHIIYNYVKKGNLDLTALPVREIFQDLESQGSQSVILGCTELPIVFNQHQYQNIKMIDPTTVLARAAITYAGGQLKNK